jgi:hypothetical protein
MKRNRLTLTLGSLLLVACVTATPDPTALVPKPPLDILTQARAELVRMGYTITQMPTDSLNEKGKEPLGGAVVGEKYAGRDLDTGGLLFEVITVMATPSGGQAQLTIHSGMELQAGNGLMRSPTASTKEVRNAAAALLKRLQ